MPTQTAHIDGKALRGAVNNPTQAGPANILALQRLAGNQAVSRLIQAKLTVGAANDRYEQEADRIAGHVVTGEQQGVRRQIDEEGVQTTATIHRAQTADSGAFEAGPQLESWLVAQKGAGQRLPTSVREFMEPRLGADLGGVRVHTDAAAEQMNRDLQAEAFTYRQDVYVRPDRFQPDSNAGRRLLAHELTHVVQQTGHDKPTAASDSRAGGTRGGEGNKSGRARRAANSQGGGPTKAGPALVQRSEDEAVLSFKSWKQASGPEDRQELKDIDEAVKAYNTIWKRKKNWVRRILALDKISQVADQVSRQKGATRRADWRATFRLAEAASMKSEELKTQRATTFAQKKVQDKRVKEVVPSLYKLKGKLEKGSVSAPDAAKKIFEEFVAYPGFTYTTATANQTLPTGLFRGSCHDFAQALADLFTEAGIGGARRRALAQRNFVTRPATHFIDRKCPGNLQTSKKDYGAVNRFFFDNHVITTSAAGDFDPTSGVRGDEVVDPALEGLERVNPTDKAGYGLGENESGYVKGPVLIKDLDEVAPTGGAGYEMRLVQR